MYLQEEVGGFDPGQESRPRNFLRREKKLKNYLTGLKKYGIICT